MKQLSLFLVLSAFATISFAQTTTFGVKAGLNLADQHISPNSAFLAKGTLATFHLGGTVDFGFKNFAIQPGLMFSVKGQQFNQMIVGGDAVATTPERYKLTYLELPLNFLYRKKLTEDVMLNLGGGPYFAYGLSARVTSSEGDRQGTFNDDPSFSVAYKNPDYGVNFMAGVKLQQVVFDVQYGLGLANLSYNPNNILKNRVWSISMGYMF
jgi:hypothetical protein